MKLYTSIEVNEIDTEVIINFEKDGDDQIEILAIIDAHTGEELNINIPDMLYNECAENYSDIMAERKSNGKHPINN